jgi:hypothetical protein
MLPYAPGSRAEIRDEEWLIRRVDPSADGGWLLTCDGISDLVRGQSSRFLNAYFRCTCREILANINQRFTAPISE